MTEIILPELGEGIKSATVAFWHVKAGGSVTAGDEICEVTTDKATFNIEAPSSGRLKAITVAVGQESKVGTVLGLIEQS